MPPFSDFDSVEAYNDYFMNVYQEDFADDSELEDEYLDFEKPDSQKRVDLDLGDF